MVPNLRIKKRIHVDYGPFANDHYLFLALSINMIKTVLTLFILMEFSIKLHTCTLKSDCPLYILRGQRL